MPSPLGHALGGIAAGWIVAGAPPRTTPWTATWRGALLLATLAMLPDVDLLFGAHSMYTHSVGAALIVLLAAIALARSHRLVTGAACSLAYASHILLDWLGEDTTPPIGIMALWPFSSGYFESDFHWFMAINRRYWLPNFWSHNVLAIMGELAILVPLVLIVYVVRRPRRRTIPARSRSG